MDFAQTINELMTIINHHREETDKLYIYKSGAISFQPDNDGSCQASELEIRAHLHKQVRESVEKHGTFAFYSCLDDALYMIDDSVLRKNDSLTYIHIED